MKSSLFKTILVLAGCLTGAGAFAQSNHVPGPQEYSGFSQFITERNIFDPNRQPHYTGSGYRRPHPMNNRMPAIQFVGTMSYNKGLFAFFSGNNSDLSQVLQVGGKVAGYTITEITPDFVAIESADKKEEPKLKVGSGFQEENGKWVLADANTMASAESASASSGSSGNSATSTESAGSTSSAPTPPPSTGEQNDVLKRLMQQREKENQ